MKPGFTFKYGDKFWTVQDNLKCKPWSLEIMAKEMKQKKEGMKAPMKSLKEKRAMKKEKHSDEKEDMKMLKKKIKKDCMK